MATTSHIEDGTESVANNEDSNQGEGNRKAARRYDEAAGRFLHSDRGQRQVRGAGEVAASDKDELEAAEEIGKSHAPEMSKGRAPSVSELASPRTPESIAADASLSPLEAARLLDEMILDLEAQLRASEEGMSSSQPGKSGQLLRRAHECRETLRSHV